MELLAAGGQDWMPVAAVVIAAVLALVGALASIIFWDLRGDIKRAVTTLDALLTRQEATEERVTWLEGFHPTPRQVAQGYRDRSNGGR